MRVKWQCAGSSLDTVCKKTGTRDAESLSHWQITQIVTIIVVGTARGINGHLENAMDGSSRAPFP